MGEWETHPLVVVMSWLEMVVVREKIIIMALKAFIGRVE